MYYPWYLVVLYVVYVVAETIPYIGMGRKDPYWVVLIYPFYGLFGFVTRIVSSIVFLYRRCMVKLNREAKLDDFNKGHFGHKLSSSFLSLSLSSSILGLTVIHRTYLPISNSPSTSGTWVSQIQSVDTPKATGVVAGVETSSLPHIYQVPLEYGDGKTSIARRAVFMFSRDNGLSLSPTQAVYAEDSLRREITMDLPKYKPGMYIQVSSDLLDKNLRKALDVGNEGAVRN